MSELIEIGGVCPLMKLLLDKGMMHGNCLTVTGKTIAENLENIKPYPVLLLLLRILSKKIAT